MDIAKPVDAITLYGFPLSGHTHRVALFLSLLDLPYRQILVDLAAGAQKRPDFLALNPFGQVPVIDDGGEPTIAEIANYSYIAHAPEGGVSLQPYPHIGAWLKRIESLPGFVAMPASQAAG